MRRLAEALRADLRLRHSLRLLAVLAMGLLIAACGGPAATPDDGQPPLLVTGVVVDGTGAPVPTQYVQISIVDHAHAQLGQPAPVVYQGQFGVGANGRFEARLAITPEIDAFAGTNDHVINFDVVAIGTDGNAVSVFVFSRTVEQGRWAGDVPFLTLRSEGTSEIDEHPSQP